MPLKGLQVIELSGLAPGPLCGKFLRDYGADVILVHKVNFNDFILLLLLFELDRILLNL